MDDVSALVDTCLFRINPTEEVVLQSLDGSVPSLRGPANSRVRIVTRQFPSIPYNEEWKRLQSEALRDVGRLAREEKIRLFTYTEIELETLAGTLTPSYVTAHALEDVQITHVPAAIERSKLQQMSLDEFCRKETRIRFCQLLLASNGAALATAWSRFGKLSEFEINNLHQIDRFQEICKTLPPKHYPDAFHLWTAEVNGLDYFVTADSKLINALTKTARGSFRTRPISPLDLVDELTRKR